MPLDYSGNPQAFQKNISKEMNAGKSQAQAVAIAYGVQGQRKPKAKRFHKVREYLRKK